MTNPPGGATDRIGGLLRLRAVAERLATAKSWSLQVSEEGDRLRLAAILETSAGPERETLEEAEVPYAIAGRMAVLRRLEGDRDVLSALLEVEVARLRPHKCWDHPVPYESDGPLGHGFECGICGAFLQAG